MRRAASSSVRLRVRRSVSAAWAPAAARFVPDDRGRLWVDRAATAPTASRFSELRWKGVDSVVPEVNVDFVWKRFVLMGSLGGAPSEMVS